MSRRVRSLFAAAALLAATACGGGGGGGGEVFFFTADFPAGVERGPQVAVPSPTSVTIAWATTTRVFGAVEFGPSDAYGSTVSDAAATRDHALGLSGLSPATTYHYRLLDVGDPAGDDHAFTTPPSDPSAPFRIVAIGDSGTGDATERDAIAQVAALTPDVILHTGDAAYRHGEPLEVQWEFVVPFAHLMATTPIFPVIGNHDFDTSGGQPLLDAMILPTNSADDTSHFYSFDWANAHVVALDSNIDASASSPQGTWLRADLAARPATTTWTIAFFHHPAYSSSRHGSTVEIDADVVPVLDEFHVDLVLNGHDHDYERTFPMVGGAPTTTGGPDYVDPAGTIYVVTGGGGKDLYPSGTSAFTAFSESVHHVTEVDVAGPTLHLAAVRSDGRTIDQMSVTKTH